MSLLESLQPIKPLSRFASDYSPQPSVERGKQVYEMLSKVRSHDRTVMIEISENDRQSIIAYEQEAK